MTLTLSQIEERLNRGESLTVEGQKTLVARIRQLLAERDAASKAPQSFDGKDVDDFLRRMGTMGAR